VFTGLFGLHQISEVVPGKAIARFEAYTRNKDFISYADAEYFNLSAKDTQIAKANVAHSTECQGSAATPK
jgi:hypothetical protein